MCSTSTYSNIEKGKIYKNSTLYDDLFDLFEIQYEKEEKSFIDKAIRRFSKCEKRKQWNEIFYFKDFSCPLTQHYTLNGFKDAFENVRLAPSAINKQPWRIVKHGEGFDFYINEENTTA